MTTVKAPNNLPGGKGTSTEEDVQNLRKLLEESQIKAKEKYQQVFKLNCQLKQENDNLISKLATEERARKKLGVEVNILKEGMQFINGEFIKCMESYANFEVGGGGESGLIEVKLNISDSFGGGEMYGNPRGYFQRQFKNLGDIYTSKLNSLREENEKMGERVKKAEGAFFKLVSDIKKGSLAKKRKREADNNASCQDKEIEVKEDQIGSHGNRKDVPLIEPVVQEKTKLTYATVAIQATRSTSQLEETGSGSDHGYDIESHDEFPTIEDAMSRESKPSVESEEDGSLEPSCSGSKEDHQGKTLWESPKRRNQVEGNKEEYKCPLCQEIFYSTFGLTTHSEEKHKDVAGLRKENSSPSRKKTKNETMKEVN